MNYYTYIYYDPSRNNEPIYVGKGQKERAWGHLRSKKGGPFINRLRYMQRNNINPIIGLYAGIDEEFALFLEEELISKYGRKDLGLGPLLNLTDGGEGLSGRKMTDETKKKMSEKRKGKKTWIVGKTHTEETKQKMKESRVGTGNSFYGKTHSEETKINQSEVMKGRLVGEKNPFFGKTHSPEIQKQISDKLRGKKKTQEELDRRRETIRLKKLS